MFEGGVIDDEGGGDYDGVGDVNGGCEAAVRVCLCAWRNRIFVFLICPENRFPVTDLKNPVPTETD